MVVYFFTLNFMDCGRTVKKVAIKILQSDWLLAVLVSALNRTVFGQFISSNAL